MILLQQTEFVFVPYIDENYDKWLS